jgi:hypothetical protein
MPFNGSGGFNPLAAPIFPAVPNTTIFSSYYNAQLNDIFAGLGNCVTRDGQSPATANLPMAGFKHTNAAAAAAAGEYLIYGQALPAGVPFTFPLGSAAAPSITFTGDTDTGIYSPGAGRIGLTNNGLGGVEFDATGSLTIQSDTSSLMRTWVASSAAPTTSANLQIRRSRGTLAAGSNVLSGDRLGALIWTGSLDASTFSNSAAVQASATQDYSPAQSGSRLEFFITPNGSLTRVERLRLDQNGTLQPGVDNAQSLGTAGLRWSDVRSVLGTFSGSINAANFLIGTNITTDAGTFGFTGSNGPGIVTWGSASGGAGRLEFYTSGALALQVMPVASATRNFQFSASVAGNPIIATSGGLIQAANGIKMVGTGSPAGDVGTTSVFINNSSVMFVDSSRTANNREAEWIWSGGTFQGRFINDAYAAATNWIQVTGGQASGVTAIDFYNGATAQAMRIAGSKVAVNNVNANNATYQLQVTGLGQAIANITDAGAKDGTLYLLDSGNSGAGQGGALLFGGFSSTTPFAAIKGMITSASNNTTGDISFSSRAVTTDAFLTERFHMTSDGRFYGTALHNNAGAMTGTTNQYVGSGTYTPTTVAQTNVSATTGQLSSWTRVGNVVTVGFGANITPTSAAVVTIRVPLPIASAMTGADLHGSCGWQHGATYGGGAVQVDTVNDVALVIYPAPNTTAGTVDGTFQYTVL